MTKALVFLAILLLLNGYVVARMVNRWPWAGQHLAVVALCAAVFYIVQALGPFGDRLIFPYLRQPGHAKALFAAVDWLSYVAFGFITSLFIYTLVADIVTIIYKIAILPRSGVNIDRRALMTLGLVGFGTTAVGIGQAEAGPMVRAVSIPLANLPAAFNGFRIVQISDLHAGSTIGRAYVEKVVSIANDLKPDLIALTGDFIDGSVEVLRDVIAPLATLAAPFGKFFVTGNHEYYWGADAWTQEFGRLGIRVLSNQHEVIRRQDGAIVLAGVTDYSTLRGDGPDKMDPHKALDGAPSGLPKILLAHQPASYRLAQAAGFDLQLSGHTHAGQYFPFNLFIGFFQRYYKGLNRHENMWVYVNRGTGYWGPPLRTGVPSEITVITLTPAAADKILNS